MSRAVILTALPVEYLAVRSHLQNLIEEIHAQGTIYERGTFRANNQNWEVGIVEIGAGNIGAALEAERAIAHFNPDVILFVGVAGGIKDVAIGDVVASTKIYGYESGKAEQRFKSRPEIGLSAYNLEQRARAEARKGDWTQRLNEVPKLTPRVFVAPIAAGEKVVTSTQSELFSFLRDNYGDAIAIEMEGIGFLEAVRANQRVSAIVIRGISDLIDNKQEVDQCGSQELASHHASAFTFELLGKLKLDGKIKYTRTNSKILTNKNQPKSDDLLINWLKNYKSYIAQVCGQVAKFHFNTDKKLLEEVFTKVHVLSTPSQTIQNRRQSISDSLMLLPDQQFQSISNLDQGDSSELSYLIKKGARIVLYGQPGAGKTTLMRYSALKLSQSTSPMKTGLPIYIELRKILDLASERALLIELKGFLERSFNDLKSDKKHKKLAVESFLSSSFLVVFLDGLDEVPLSQLKKLSVCIDYLKIQYPQSCIVISSRMSEEYFFDDFNSVEVAKFTTEQIQAFSQKFFRDTEYCQLFFDNLCKNTSLLELATTPLLLQLLALTFDSEKRFSGNRYNLYCSAAECLMDKWDTLRRISRSKVLPDRNRKEDLLAQIAFNGLSKTPPQTMWDRRELTVEIYKFIEMLDTSQYGVNIEVSTDDVIKQLEVSEGLIIRESTLYYSFSHLTFQEYFTAHYIAENLNLQLQSIEKHLLDRQWREVFLLMAGKLRNAENFLTHMLSYTNKAIESNSLQEILKWLNRVTSDVLLMSSGWRCAYLLMGVEINFYFSKDNFIEKRLLHNLIEGIKKLEHQFFDKSNARNITVSLQISLGITYTLAEEYGSPIINKTLTEDIFESWRSNNVETTLLNELATAISCAEQMEGREELASLLRDLYENIPNEYTKKSWLSWSQSLKAIMTKYVKIGHGIKLGEEDLYNFNDYLYANNLILDCMQVGIVASKSFRKDLIDSLLLPGNQMLQNGKSLINLDHS